MITLLAIWNFTETRTDNDTHFILREFKNFTSSNNIIYNFFIIEKSS